MNTFKVNPLKWLSLIFNSILLITTEFGQNKHFTEHFYVSSIIVHDELSKCFKYGVIFPTPEENKVPSSSWIKSIPYSGLLNLIKCVKVDY